MPKICLKAPPRAGQQKKTSLATLVNRQIGNFCQIEDLTSFWVLTLPESLTSKKRGALDRISYPRKSIEGNIRGAVRIASSADEMEPPNIRSIEVLKTKHQEAPNVRLFSKSRGT